MLTRNEAISLLSVIYHGELMQLPLKQRIAKMADLLAQYRKEHPEESDAWTAEYFDD